MSDLFEDPRISNANTLADTLGFGAAGNVHAVTFSRYIIDNDLRIVKVDDNFTLLTGYTVDEVKENNMSQMDLLPEEDRLDYMAMLTEQLSKDQSAYFEHRIKRKDGSVMYVFCYGRNYFDSAAAAYRSAVIITDSSKTYALKHIVKNEREKASERLKRWEHTYRKDSLTRLLTHGAFRNDVEEKLFAGNDTVLFMMLDLDKFKEYNDTYGHQAGDELLILLAQTIENSLRKNDLSCRMGGDEFAAALFFRKGSTVSLIERRARQIFDNLNMTIKSVEGASGISMGAVLSNDRLNTFRDLYAASDKALYRSKQLGRGRVTLYDESMFEEKTERE